MQRKVRDDKYKLGLLKPDTFAEDRLLRQPPGVCIMLVMYNRYHNYAATQLRRINENGRFSVPKRYTGEKLVATAKQCIPAFKTDPALRKFLADYEREWKNHRKSGIVVPENSEYAEAKLQQRIDAAAEDPDNTIEGFQKAYEAAWNKLDDDLFHTARLITCGMYVNISIHDYLRALMGFHQYDTTFTLDPRIAINKHGQRDAVSRGIGNQVTTEFNLLYRFHCAISKRDEEYTEKFMKESIGPYMGKADWDPKTLNLADYLNMSRAAPNQKEPWENEFGLRSSGPRSFVRNSISGLFDDQQMVNELRASMDEPISNFGPLNVPRCLKTIEIIGIIQARKWEVGTLNDFRDFFGMDRHKDFKSITPNTKVQTALRDLYDHPDKVELYPGIFCESDSSMDLDPGPKEKTFALWAAIFSDAITLVRSDRFYTVDWNTNSLTSWGMKEVTPDSDILKSSVYHRLIQRAFPEWFPPDSICFFHPFYTPLQNAKFARQQNYEKEFKMSSEVTKRDCLGHPKDYAYDWAGSEPSKPVKPNFLTKYAVVRAALSDASSDILMNPACFDRAWMPERIAEILAPGYLKLKPSEDKLVSANATMVLDYFTAVTREIINREAYAVDDQPTYQLDVTRDLAIPVVTSYIADFLGFSHRVRSTGNTNAEFSENKIYQHITNCQAFLAYNADRTKALGRRAAAKRSMKFLLDLTESGNIKAASRFSLSHFFGGEKPPQNMKEVGMTVARQTLKRENNILGKAAAVLLLTALDGAYNSVLAFSAVLNYFMDGLYEGKGSQTKPSEVIDGHKKCKWEEIQDLALADSEDADKTIRKMVLAAQHHSVKLSVVRRAEKAGIIRDDNRKEVLSVEKDQIIVCDIHRAYVDQESSGARAIADAKSNEDFLIFGSSLSEGFSHFNSRDTAVLGLTAMIKVLAQTKNLRRGHDTQGRLKKIDLDETEEGYANFMAPGRMRDIRLKVQSTLEGTVTGKLQEDALALKTILEHKVLQPQTDTYMTAEWDEMVPFPTTWKLRFDGYGSSDYPKVKLIKPSISDSEPPFYQPQRPSHYGGSFAETVCIPSNESKVPKQDSSKETDTLDTLSKATAALGGCGAPGAKI